MSEEGKTMNTSSVAKMKEFLEGYPDDHMLLGNCVDKFGNWYNYPVFMGKVPGNNNMIAVQLKPIEDGQIQDPYGYMFTVEVDKVKKKVFVIADNIADATDKMDDKFPGCHWEMETHSSVEVID